MVLHEEQQPKCSNSSSSGLGGSKRSKKSKQKKEPQRGLGVAQLERIRLEEQQKNAAAAAAASSSPNSSFSGLLLPPLQPPTAPNSLFRPSMAVSSAPINFLGPTPTHIGCGIGSTEQGFFLPMLCNAMQASPHDVEAMNMNFGFNSPLQNDPLNPVWRPSGLLQRQQQSPLVNNSLSPSSSGVNLQMEPPSNQSYISNCNMPFSRLDDERMVGMKRPWPFPPHDMSCHASFPSKIPPFKYSFPKLDESLSIYGHDLIKFESNNTNVIREGNSSSNTYQVDWRSPGLNLDKSAMDGGFLTLGPSLPPKSKQSTITSTSHHDEYPEFNLLPYQGSMDEASSKFGGSAQPFYSFLPVEPNNCETSLNERRRGDASESIDLNLRL